MGTKLIKQNVTDIFIKEWHNSINDSYKNPGARCYNTFKNIFEFEPYLLHVKNIKHRIALSKLRCSSHCLEIERGRHNNPVTPVENRLCPQCDEIDTETHFMIHCSIHATYRQSLFDNIQLRFPMFKYLTPQDKFIFLMKNKDSVIVCLLAKYVYLSFEQRKLMA